MEELTKLPVVGRKTANVILGVLHNRPEGVVVDTHVSRISFRLGLTETRNGAEKIEKELHNIIEPKYREKYSLYMINHGRKYCTARKPKCDICPLNKICNKNI
jgi:endonuclease-3